LYTTLVVLGVGRTIAIALADSGREEHLSTSIAVSGSLNSTDVDFSNWTFAKDDEELVNDNQQHSLNFNHPKKFKKKNIISPANKRENGINYNLLIKISNVPNLPSIYLKAK
jgi:hypothetical protein